MSRESYETVIGLEVHAELSQKQKYSVVVQQNLVEHQTHIHVQYVWQCQELYQY